MRRMLLLWLSLQFITAVKVPAQEDTAIINESTYKLKSADGQEQIVYRGNPLFYQERGEWKRIDPNWRMSGDNLASVTGGVYSAMIDTLGNVKVRYNNREIGWRLMGLFYFDNASRNRVPIGTLSWKKPLLQGDSLVFRNLLPGIDYILRYHSSTLIGYVKISASARTALPDPQILGIGESNAWVALVYKLDLADLKDFYEGADSVRWLQRLDSTNPILIRQSADSMWGVFPQEVLYTADPLFKPQLLRKTFLKSGSDFLLILSFPYTQFVNLPASEIIFDDAVQIKGTSKITDSWLDQTNPLTNYGNSTTNQWGVGVSSSTKMRTVIKWDFSDIPSGSTITAAVDSHYYNLGASCSTADQDLEVGRLTRFWEEGECGWTYAERNPDVAWTTVGGDYSDIILNATIGNPNGWISVSGFQSTVQNWLNGTWTNYGCLWKVIDETEINSCKVFYSSEHATNDPRLYVTYTPPGSATVSRRLKTMRSN